MLTQLTLHIRDVFVAIIATFALGLDIFTQDETDELYVDGNGKVDKPTPQDTFEEKLKEGLHKPRWQKRSGILCKGVYR